MAALNLPKAARLARRAEFSEVRERGRSQHGALMVVGTWQSSSASPPRCGVVTSRRVGTAVERNRTRRRLREIFRLNRSMLPAGLCMVIVPRRAAVRATFAALAEEWRALCARAGYLKA